MRTVFDTNILIDLLKGSEVARAEVKRADDAAISHITWMELLVGASPEREAAARQILSDFRLLPITAAIAEQAVLERRQRRIKLPDAITIATAVAHNGILLTRNTRDFPRNERHIRIPYHLPIA